MTSAVNLLYKIDKKKYNNSLINLIEAQKQYRDTTSVSLYKITDSKEYLTEAQSLAEGSYLYFGKKQADGRISILDDTWFTVVLFRGYQDLYEVDGNSKYVDIIIKNINYAWKNARDNKGLIYSNWNAEKDESKTPK